MANFFEKLKNGLTKTRENITGKMNEVLGLAMTIDEDLFEELEEVLITSDVGYETSMELIERLRKKIRLQKVTEVDKVRDVLKEVISEFMEDEEKTFEVKKPTILLIIGVNGVGKTTSIGKLAFKYKNEGKKVILAAADTFRAAAIDQLEVWAKRAEVDIVRHQEGSDPAAVVYDALEAFKARNADVLLCDTAGRLHNKKNLMNELEKIRRVIDREFGDANIYSLLVLDGTSGQNAVIQAKEFQKVAQLDGIILTKLDGTAKGGIVISIRHTLNIPVKLIGVGEGIEDLQEFNPRDFADALF